MPNPADIEARAALLRVHYSDDLYHFRKTYRAYYGHSHPRWITHESAAWAAAKVAAEAAALAIRCGTDLISAGLPAAIDSYETAVKALVVAIRIEYAVLASVAVERAAIGAKAAAAIAVAAEHADKPDRYDTPSGAAAEAAGRLAVATAAAEYAAFEISSQFNNEEARANTAASTAATAAAEAALLATLTTFNKNHYIEVGTGPFREAHGRLVAEKSAVDVAISHAIEFTRDVPDAMSAHEAVRSAIAVLEQVSAAAIASAHACQDIEAAIDAATAAVHVTYNEAFDAIDADRAIAADWPWWGRRLWDRLISF